MTRATSRYDAIGGASRVAWMEGEPSLSRVQEESSFLRVSAHLFCGFMMPTTYDAGHHNYEWFLIARESTIFMKHTLCNDGVGLHLSTTKYIRVRMIVENAIKLARVYRLGVTT